MPRLTLGRFPRLATLAFAAALSIGIASAASADTPPGRGPNGGPAPTPPTTPAGDCAVLRVQLNGTQPAIKTCLDVAQPGQRLPTTTNCWASDFQIFQDSYYGGKKLCFYGSGFVRLNEYPLYSYLSYPTWDDRISSFKTGQFYVDFYEHNNAGGEQIRYAPWQERPTMRTGWNDRVSSICIHGPNILC
jgi:hypothetical protein